MKLKNIKTIAVINLGFVGDVVNASCITIELKKAYPDAKLVFITVPKSKEIAKYLPGVDAVEIFDKDIEHKGMKMLPLILKLKLKHNFDMSILLNETFRSGLFAFLLGARYRVGHDSEGRGMFLTHTVPWPDEEKDFKVHIAEIYMRNLKAIDLYNSDYKFGLNYSQSDADYINDLLIQSGLENNEIIGLCPCARYGCKDWIPEEGAEFINYVNKNTPYKVVIIGQDSGKDFADNIRKLGVNDFIDFSNKTNVPQLSALIKRFKVFVSVDTAPMHMGIALEVPTIGMFVQSNYGKWWPGDNDKRKLLHENGKNTAIALIRELNKFL